MLHALPDWLFVAALALGGVAWFRHDASSSSAVARRSRSPLWTGFTATFAATMFVVAGLVGFNLDRHSRFASGTAWSDGVIWWEVATGLVLAPIAILLVRRGIRDLHEEVRTAHMAATRTR
jgi:hypothetical protein